MFRQHIFSCNCSLFPSNISLHQQFRSPVSHITPATKRYKRSLKSQSTSRNRQQLDAPIRFQNKVSYGTKRKQSIQNVYHHQPIRVHTSVSPQALDLQKKQTQNYERKPTITIRLKRQDNPINMYKENYSERLQFNEPTKRVMSPLQSQQANQLPLRKTEVSPPAMQKIKKVCEQSAATTLAGSLAPSFQSNQPSCIQPSNSFKSFHCMKQDFRSKARLSTLWDERQQRQRVNSNAFGLPKLTELMSEKDEAESIYEESIDEVDESRVLISCKKLMEEKQGKLEKWDHIRLFDFGQEKYLNQDRNQLFENISLSPLPKN